mmetsp:Transcript_45726/g.115091  ORF Transcript_45726/g.115091 Transcript_45726/m.115091 type:complete len:231 (-) Transcript_45726:648-1340(-)
MVSSQEGTSHQGASTTFFSLSVGTSSSHLVIVVVDWSRTVLAAWNMVSWTSSRMAAMRSCRPSSATDSLAPPTRRATMTAPFSTSLGPTSTRTGTPFTSQKLYLNPGLYCSRSSRWARTPAAASRRCTSAANSLTLALSPPLKWMGTMTTWMGATRGGSTSPLSSPCTITITPIARVLMPQLFCQANAFSFLSFSNWMLNIFEKFWPSACDVAACTPRPFAATNASHVVV